MVTVVQLFTGQAASEVMADALLGYMSPTRYAVDTFRAVERMANLGRGISVGEDFHEVAHRGNSLIGQKTVDNKNLRLMCGATQDEVRRHMTARFSLGVSKSAKVRNGDLAATAGTSEKIYVEAMAATVRGAVMESHVLNFKAQEAHPRLIEVRDGNVDLSKASQHFKAPDTSVSFTRGIPVVEIPRTGFSEIFLKRLFPRITPQGQTEPALILGFAMYAATQLFESLNSGDKLTLDLKMGSKNLFHTKDLQELLEVFDSSDESLEFDKETVESAGELLYFLKDLAAKKLNILRSGMALLGENSHLQQILDASEALDRKQVVENLEERIDHAALSVEAGEVSEKIAELMQSGAEFTVSVGLGSDSSRLHVKVTPNAISVGVYVAPTQTNAGTINISRYHKKFLAPMVHHILGKERGPIALIRLLAGRQRRGRRGKGGRPQLKVFSGGRDSHEK